MLTASVLEVALIPWAFFVTILAGGGGTRMGGGAERDSEGGHRVSASQPESTAVADAPVEDSGEGNEVSSCAMWLFFVP